MRSKEVEEDIEHLKNKIKSINRKFTHEEILRNIEAIENILSYISELEEENEDAKEYADVVWRKQEELRVKIEELEANNYECNNIINDQIELLKDNTPNSVIREKIEEYQNLLNTCNKKEDIERIKALNERILVLKEILGEK